MLKIFAPFCCYKNSMKIFCMKNYTPHQFYATKKNAPLLQGSKVSDGSNTFRFGYEGWVKKERKMNGGEVVG